jgi:hypothetical protein
MFVAITCGYNITVHFLYITTCFYFHFINYQLQILLFINYQTESVLSSTCTSVFWFIYFLESINTTLNFQIYIGITLITEQPEKSMENQTIVFKNCFNKEIILTILPLKRQLIFLVLNFKISLRT